MVGNIKKKINIRYVNVFNNIAFKNNKPFKYFFDRYFLFEKILDINKSKLKEDGKSRN